MSSNTKFCPVFSHVEISSSSQASPSEYTEPASTLLPNPSNKLLSSPIQGILTHFLPPFLWAYTKFCHVQAPSLLPSEWLLGRLPGSLQPLTVHSYHGIQGYSIFIAVTFVILVLYSWNFYTHIRWNVSYPDSLIFPLQFPLPFSLTKLMSSCFYNLLSPITTSSVIMDEGPWTGAWESYQEEHPQWRIILSPSVAIN